MLAQNDQNADAYIGIRVPEPIKQDWLERARLEQRSLSNWILHKMTAADNQPSSESPTRSKRSTGR